MDINSIKLNESNPREITPEQFEKLQNDIEGFKKMMKYRPIIYDSDKVIIGGNMRYRALVALGYKTIPNGWAVCADDFTEEEIRKFIVLDNAQLGTWDWDLVTSQYSTEELIEWGIEIPVDPIPEAEPEVPPESHGFKIKCEDLDELIELREMLNADVESKSMSYGNFKMIFEKRIT